MDPCLRRGDETFEPPANAGVTRLPLPAQGPSLVIPAKARIHPEQMGPLHSGDETFEPLATENLGPAYAGVME